MTSFKSFALGLSLWGAAALAVAAPLPECNLTGLQIAAGHVTFANTVKFFSAIGAALFACVFFNALRGLFKKVPMAVWKSLAYAGSIALCCGSLWLSPDHAPIAQAIGAFLLAACLGVILRDAADAFGVQSRKPVLWHASVAIMGLGLAMLQTNPMVAAVGVLGVMALIGFSMLPTASLNASGYASDSSIARATAGALGILIPCALIRAGSGSLGVFEVLWPAIAWICSLTAGLGLLITSSRFYDQASKGFVYVVRNALALAFGLFCLWAGSMHGMSELQRAGGTLIIIWLFLKPWDIPNAGAVWRSLLGLLSCAALYFLAQDIISSPERWSSILLF